MRKIKIDKKRFYADYFWSKKDGSEIREDIFVLEYLKNYFTFKDLLVLCELVGKERLLNYAKKLNMESRISHLLEKTGL